MINETKTNGGRETGAMIALTRAGAIAAAAPAGPSLYDAPESLMQDEQEDNADRRARRITKFVERERTRDPRRWTSFAEIARLFFLEYGDKGRREAYVRLLTALVDGQFGWPLFLSAQWTDDWALSGDHMLAAATSPLEWSGCTDEAGCEELRKCIAAHPSEFKLIKDAYLDCCWVRRAKADKWVKQEKPKGKWVRPDPPKRSETTSPDPVVQAEAQAGAEKNAEDGWQIPEQMPQTRVDKIIWRALNRKYGRCGGVPFGLIDKQLKDIVDNNLAAGDKKVSEESVRKFRIKHTK